MAGLLLAGNLGSFLHQVLIGHAPCPVHGGLAHVLYTDPGGGGERGRPTGTDPRSSGHLRPLGAPPTSVYVHVHCRSCSLSSEQAAIVPGPALRVPPLAATRAPSPVATRRPVGRVAAYVLAPKQSPPPRACRISS